MMTIFPIRTTLSLKVAQPPSPMYYLHQLILLDRTTVVIWWLDSHTVLSHGLLQRWFVE